MNNPNFVLWPNDKGRIQNISLGILIGGSVLNLTYLSFRLRFGNYMLKRIDAILSMGYYAVVLIGILIINYLNIDSI